jgi:hypothetical protein
MGNDVTWWKDRNQWMPGADQPRRDDKPDGKADDPFHRADTPPEVAHDEPFDFDDWGDGDDRQSDR